MIAYVISITTAIAFGYGIFASYKAPETPPAGIGTNQPPGNPDETVNRPASANMGSVVMYVGLTVLSLAGLGLLIAHDVSSLAARQVEDFIFNDNLEGVKDPEYDEAEQVWADGNHLEAVRLMRDYLKTHPREQYVALRIAEIYEKDLGNYLAAALEYEEILKKKLPPERWGWAAIHLANLYSGKLNKMAAAEALLHRMVGEYGHTAAAKKARERLGIPEPSVESAPAPGSQAQAPPSNLPPGFRPK